MYGKQTTYLPALAVTIALLSADATPCSWFSLSRELRPEQIRAKMMPLPPGVEAGLEPWSLFRRRRVFVKRGENTEYFYLTRRGAVQIRREMLLPEFLYSTTYLRGLRGLDMGAGHGKFVDESRKRGIEMDGLDIALTRRNLQRSHFIRADMTETGLPAESYDVVYALNTLISYELDKDQPDYSVIQKAFAEASRLLAPGGTYVVSPIRGRFFSQSGRVFFESPTQEVIYVPGFDRIMQPDSGWMSQPVGEGLNSPASFAELTKPGQRKRRPMTAPRSTAVRP